MCVILCLGRSQVWDKSDYNLMKEKISRTLSYSHYYYRYS